MKVGDLVRYIGDPIFIKNVGGEMGIVVRVCEEVITTVDLLIGGKIMYDQRIYFLEVVSESR